MAYGARRSGPADAARAEMLAPGMDEDAEAIAAFNGEDGEDEELDPYEELAAVLMAEAADSLGLDGDAIADDQVRAFERYIGKDYGDEVDGQSRVHTREVFETIEWMRPDMARIFAAGPGCLEVEFPDDPTGEMAEQAQTLLYWRIFGEDNGLDIVDSFFFNGALQKLGVIGVYWEEEQLEAPTVYENLTQLQAQDLAGGGQVGSPGGDQAQPAGAPGGEGEPVEAEFEELDGDAPADRGDLIAIEETGEANGEKLYTVRFQKVKRKARPCMDVIAPEDFRVSKRAVSLEKPFYSGYTLRMMLSDVVEMWPDVAEDEIAEAAASARNTMDTDERRMARFEFDDEGDDTRPATNDNEVLVEREYVYFDKDGDGYPELLECWRIGSLVLEAEETDENCFAGWSPIRIPHKLVGMSIADITEDLQRALTVLLRASMNAAQLAVAPRTVVTSGVNLADLLSVRPGAVIRLAANTQGKAQDNVHALTTPDVAGSGLQMMDKLEKMLEARSGVTRHSQGLNPDVLHKTMGGVALLQNSAAIRKEMTARNLAQGLSDAFTKYLRLIIRHGDKQQSVGKGKERRDVDISGWSPDVKVKVHVGQGTGNREAQLMNLMQLLQLQKALIDELGADNPIVTPRHRYNTIEQITRAMGFQSAEQFFADPDKLDEAGKAKLMQAMQPKPDPAMQKAMAQLQADQKEWQGRLEFMVKELTQKGQLKREEIASGAQLQREQLDAEVTLAREEMTVDAVQKAVGQSPAGGPNTRPGGDKV